MDTKKIPTGIGTVVLVVIAVTVMAFVGVYEMGQDGTPMAEIGTTL